MVETSGHIQYIIVLSLPTVSLTCNIIYRYVTYIGIGQSIQPYSSHRDVIIMSGTYQYGHRYPALYIPVSVYPDILAYPNSIRH